MEPRPTCPHCDQRTLPLARIDGNVVAIMHCPCKEQLLLLFRNQIIPLKRQILEQGTFEERKEHLGTIAAAIFELGMRQGQGDSLEEMFSGWALPTLEVQDDSRPITADEVEKFVRVDLKCLDNPAYFRRHFGN